MAICLSLVQKIPILVAWTKQKTTYSRNYVNNVRINGVSYANDALLWDLQLLDV